MTGTVEDHANERARPRRPRDEKRDPDFVVRVRTGTTRRSWATIGYAWAREKGEGYSVKLNALPIGNEWNGILKLLPPYVSEEDVPDDEDTRQ
jgi:hypothetical protein